MRKISKISLFSLMVSLAVAACTSTTIEKEPCKKTENENQKHRRFFSDESFWNQPIPDNPEIDERNDTWIELLKKEPTKEFFGISYKKWTVPVYEANASTPMVPIQKYSLTDVQKKVWNTHTDNDQFGHGPDFSPVPIPVGAEPDPEADAHFCVVDWNRMLAWDMWGLAKQKDGSLVSKTGMMYRLDGDGIFDAKELGYIDGESVHFHGPSRAAGVPVIAGLIMYDEVMEGEIRHKLSFATRIAGYKEYVYPASWTDGFVNNGIPEGAVIQLDPNLDLTQFDLTPEETVIVVALQKYGAVCVDVAQGQPIFAEGLWGHPDKSWEGKIRDWDGGINDIPYDHYRVLKVENSFNKGDERRENMPYWTTSSNE